jgi:glycosyltransferase involved in cell wall biosynthesis
MTAHCDKRRYVHKLFRVGRGLIQRHIGGFPHAVDHYVALSNRSAEVLAPYLPKSAHLHYLENAIDWKQPAPVDPAANGTILYVGRLDHEKGVLLLADAIERCGMQATFVGDGPMRPALENRKGIHLTGWVSREAVRAYLMEARCVVFPSLWYETYGLVVAEAAAYGIPVIASDITAAAERIGDGETGWLFRSGDSGDLARCLDITRNDDAIARAGATAYAQFWSQATTSAGHAEDLLRIYRAILTPQPNIS